MTQKFEADEYALETRAITTLFEPVLGFDVAHDVRLPSGSLAIHDWPLADYRPPPVSTDDARDYLRLSSCSSWRLDAQQQRAVTSADWRLLQNGPAQLVDVAREITRHLSDYSAALAGSLAMILQRPYRLSLDVDLICFGGASAGTKIGRRLEALGATVSTVRAAYVGAYIETQLGIATIDVEVGTLYRQSARQERLPLVMMEGLPCCRVDALSWAKGLAGRAKDLADLNYLRSTADDS